MVALTAAAFPCAPVRAGHVELGAGLVQPGLNHTEQPWAVGTAWRFGYGHPLSERGWFVASLTYANVLNDTSSTSTIKLSFPNEHADRRWRMGSFDLGAQFYLNRSKSLLPYARGMIGASFWSVKYLNGDPVPATALSGAPTDFSAQEVALRLAFGVTYKVSAPIGASVELEGTYLTGLGADLSANTDQARSRGLVTLMLKMSYDLGHASGHVQFADAGASPGRPSPVTLSPPADSDSDGVPDLVDRCSGTPRAAAGWVDVEGCPVDSDRDGVFDYQDRCPLSGARWPVDSTGCVEDSDEDGIPDAADVCADTPPGLRVDSVGCPDYPPITSTVVLRFEYPSGGTQLDPAAQARLRELVPAILYHPGVKIQICGFTDNIGAVESNLALSQKRANVVKEFLVSEGIPAAQLSAVGRGESNFVASNETSDGRAQNRRIEIIPMK